MKRRGQGGQVALTASAMGIGALVTAVGGAGIGIAAASGHGGGVIHGCVAKSNGTLRIVKSAGDCTAHEKPISFNKQGPPGQRGPQGPSGSGGGTTTMFANLDQFGNLGSNHDAVSARDNTDAGYHDYVVTFNRSIRSCAAVAQPGFAGGNDAAGAYVSQVVYDPNNADAFHVAFFDPHDANGYPVATAFMLVVTCGG